MALDWESECVSVNKQSNDDVMHLTRFGKADRLACQALDARTKRQMLPFNSLRVALARMVDVRFEVSRVCPPIICMKSPDSIRLQQRFQLEKHVIRASAKNICQDLAGPVINGIPEPPLVSLLPDKAPHFIHLRLGDPTDHDVHVAGMQSVHEGLVDGFERSPFFLIRELPWRC
jgi:hypothetical protein